MFYAKSTGGFYSREIHGDAIPADAVEITDTEHAALLDAQSHGKIIQAENDGKPIAVDPPKPTAADMLGRIKAKRDQIVLQGIKVGTKWYHSDEASRTKYIGLLRMADAAVTAGGAGTTPLQYGGQDIQWKTMDGTFIKMTVQRANDVFAAVSGLDFAAFAVAETHKAAMEVSADPAAYDFSSGWPATFPG